MEIGGRQSSILNAAPGQDGVSPSPGRFSSSTALQAPHDANTTADSSPTDDQIRLHSEDKRSFLLRSQSQIDSSGQKQERVVNTQVVLSSETVRPPDAVKTDVKEVTPVSGKEKFLEEMETITERHQAMDLTIKTRVRMAKFGLRGISFCCSIILLSMIATSFSVFNSTKGLLARKNLPAWADDTDIAPQIIVLVASCTSLAVCTIVLLAYCRAGHRGAEKIGRYHTLFAVGWLTFSLVMWGIAAGIFRSGRTHDKNMWGWSCKDNDRSKLFEDTIDYSLVCRLQDWSLVCIIIEVAVDAVTVALYTVIFYRWYSKYRLFKAMKRRDEARSEFYLAQSPVVLGHQTTLANLAAYTDVERLDQHTEGSPDDTEGAVSGPEHERSLQLVSPSLTPGLIRSHDLGRHGEQLQEAVSIPPAY